MTNFRHYGPDDLSWKFHAMRCMASGARGTIYSQIRSFTP